MSEPVLAARGLKRSFTQGGTTIQVLRGIDLSIAPGEIVALLGPSGSGKSTLLQAVGLLEGGFEGSIKIRGEEAAHLDDDGRTRLRRETLGFVYQFHHLLADFDATENVMLPQVIFGTEPAAARERAEQLLATLGLGQRLDHRPAKLSGGEQQRVAVARALANRPPLVLADEPTGNLDETTADRVLAEFLQLVRGEGSAALIATHNERLAQKMDRLVRLHEGNPRMRIVVAVACALLLTGCGGSDNQDKLPDDLRSAEGAEEAAPAVANSLAPEPEDTPPPVAPAIGGSDNVEDEPVDDLAPLPAPPRALPKPSFDCSGALSRVETLICNDPELALLDRRLARNYGRAIDESAPDQRSRLTNLGRRYLADRNRCPTRACVVQSYRWYLRDIDVVMGWPTP